MTTKTAQFLTRIGAYAALIAAVYFTAAAGLFLFNLSISHVVLEGFGENWLILIFKNLAAFPGADLSQIYRFNYLDTFLLLLTGLVMAGLAARLWAGAGRVWILLALVQPFLGIFLFALTQNAGRSSLMGSVLVMSIAMLRGDGFSRRQAVAGICAGLFLFAGDLGVGGGPSLVLAVLFVAGYLALIFWFYYAFLRLNFSPHAQIEFQSANPQPR